MVDPQVPMLPVGEEQVPVIRTDFSDSAAWTAAVDRVSASYGEENGYPVLLAVAPIDDLRYEGCTPEQLLGAAPEDTLWPMLVVADKVTMASPERHLLLVSLDEDHRGETARAKCAAVVEIGINLFLGNMDWEEYVGDGSDDEVLEPWSLPEEPVTS